MVLVNVSIDDVSPHPKSSTKIFEKCRRLLEYYPDIVFTLFIPISYWRTIGDTATQYPLQINKYPEFCQELRDLPKKNFEVCYHGFHHGIPHVSNNDEFKNLNCAQAKHTFDMMFKVVELAGLEDVFKPIFRPPAWRMSQASFDACKQAEIEVLALSADNYVIFSYERADNSFEKVVYYTSAPPWRPLILDDRTEIVYHACEWDKNFLSDHAVDDLLQLFAHQDIEFVSIADLVTDERCLTCHQRYESGPTCSSGFHMCRACTWVQGQRIEVCARCKAVENG